jgi:predicted glycosyltransferase
MRIMIGIGHPKQAHLWRNIIRNLVDDGHEVKILATDKDITIQLLSACGFDYEVYGKHQRNMVNKAGSVIVRAYRSLVIAKKFRPDILIAGTPHLSYVSKILGKPHIMLTDTEHANIAYWLTYPFTDAIITPSCFKGKINPKKHVTFDGYFELAYLHPNHFKPDPSVLADMKLDKNDIFTILRFVAWEASHDLGDRGFSDKKEVIKTLEQYGRVFITSESGLPREFEKYGATIPPEKMHHLMYYANLFIGESAPMSTESAILGTPALFVSTSRRGYTDELESKYDMLYTFSDPHDAQKKALEKAIELLEDKDTKKKWQKKRKILLDEKIDVTKFMTEFIEGYPESFHILQKNNVYAEL